jgi:hypothetical protein
MANHFVSACCRGEKCGMCLREGKKVEPTHKVGEEFFHDMTEIVPEFGNVDPYEYFVRHNLTQYLCCEHFAAVMGPLAAQWCGIQDTEEDA